MFDSSRRIFLTGVAASLAASALGGCVTTSSPDLGPVASALPPPPAQPPVPDATASVDEAPVASDYAKIYGPVDTEPFPVPAIKLSQIDKAFLRKQVSYNTSEPAGTIVIDPANHYLYHVEDHGKAMRYGVGVGREGFAWSGDATINFKREWPDWYPPKEMFLRQPELKKVMTQLQSGIGMAGGPKNPLGARAMYLWQGKVDTLFRIHGTVEPWTIGKSVSSGCIRMINQDVIDLYERTPLNTRVVVLGNAKPSQAKVAER